MGKIIQIEAIRLEKKIGKEEIKLQRAINLGQENKAYMYIGSIYKKRELLKLLKVKV